jgi:hypothetical protein
MNAVATYRNINSLMINLFLPAFFIRTAFRAMAHYQPPSTDLLPDGVILGLFTVLIAYQISQLIKHGWHWAFILREERVGLMTERNAATHLKMLALVFLIVAVVNIAAALMS